MGFLFAVCHRGAEGALKDEAARAGYRFAFSRPGLVTFKSDDEVAPDVQPGLVFARAWGRSIGPAATVDEIVRLAAPYGDKLRLHVFPRDEEPDDPALREALLATGRFLEDPIAKPGERVIDVITEPRFVGVHVQDRLRTPYPGGRIPVEIPAEAPSRAYAKLEEALAWSRAPVRAGQTALEIGSAPGGASYALLRRGLHVVGVDPGAMAPIVADDPRFRHLQVPVGAVRREDLPPRVDWLLLDVNLAPQVALHAVRRLVPPLRKHLLGVLLTLKMNDWAFAREIPSLLRRVEELGMKEVRATQLPSNRQEIFVYGRTAVRARTKNA